MSFSTESPGIKGKFKQRYSDFIVEEIRENKTCKVKRFVLDDASENASVIIPPEQPKDREFSQLHCDLEKFNCDTNFVISRLSRFLQCSKKRIGYAGLKDKRAITCQRISLFQPDLEKLREFHSRAIDLRDFEWQKERIEIGNLKGNAFTIAIRNIEGSKKEIKEKIEKLFKEINEKGVANYFGEQRFGGIRQVTHLVGKEIIKGNMENAVMLYLTHPSEKEPEELKEARKHLEETKDFSDASKTFPVKNRFERSMIHHLCKYPKDFAGCFAMLPKPMRYLFPHAYQSFLFNRIISERLKQGTGLQPVTEDILEDGIATAPLFGFETKFTEGKQGEIEKKIIEKEGISLKEFQVKQLPEASSRGSRKKIVLHPKKMKLLSVEEDEFNENRIKAKLFFELEKGSYATTVLREIMK